MIARRVLLNAAVALFTLSSTLVATADGAKLKKIGPAKVLFFALGPAGMKINGESGDLKVEDGDKLKFTTKMTTFKTGMGLRDEHLQKYMETGKYPTTQLVVDKGKIKMPEDKKTSQGSLSGKLTLHGVTKDVKFEYQAKRMGSDYLVQGKFGVDIVNYGVEQPCYLGVCMDTKVNMKVSFKLRQ